MQAFYAWLTSAGSFHTPYLDGLSQLTRLSLEQIRALQSDLVWSVWG